MPYIADTSCSCMCSHMLTCTYVLTCMYVRRQLMLVIRVIDRILSGQFLHSSEQTLPECLLKCISLKCNLSSSLLTHSVAMQCFACNN